MILGLIADITKPRTHEARSNSQLRVTRVYELRGTRHLWASNHLEPESPELFGRSLHVIHFFLRDHDVEF